MCQELVKRNEKDNKKWKMKYLCVVWIFKLVEQKMKKKKWNCF